MKITVIFCGLVGCVLVKSINPGLYPHVLGIYITALVIDGLIWVFNS